MVFLCKNTKLELSGRSRLMGILNVTPDSFSDGGMYQDVPCAVDHALEMWQQGADIIDIGGESTRPGAESLSIAEELRRVIPVIEGIKQQNQNILISIDTTKSEVAREAVSAGADIINDISGLQADERIAEVASEFGAGLILMHMRGTPQTMQHEKNLLYDDIVADIVAFFRQVIQRAMTLGVKQQALMIDPGIGFAKNCMQNLQLLKQINDFKTLELPILVGHSRKSFIGKVLGEELPENRIWGTAGVTAWLIANDVDVIRVHDVKEMKQVMKMFEVCRNPELFKESS